MSGTKPLPENFFNQDVKDVAQELLGKTLCVRQNLGTIIKDIISETEAYDGENDLACHASKGKTPRTSIMYEQGGVCYVYLCYGMHWMLNFVTGSPEYPAAVLIRGSLGVNGPGRLTKHFGIDGSFNKKCISKSSLIWVESSDIQTSKIHSGPRIGVNYAGPVWSKVPYRFWFSKS